MASIARTCLLRQSQQRLATRTTPMASRLLSQAIRSPSRSPLLASIPQKSAFTTSTQKKIMPPGPQVIDGGINDPQPVPPASPIHGSYHWTFERALSIGLIPLTIAPFAAGSISPVVDATLIFALIIHSYMGFQSCITDYFSTKKHPVLRKTFDWILNIATVLVAIGFYEFETNDVGVAQAIKRVWHAGRMDATIGKADPSGLGHDGKLKHLKS